MSLKASGSHSTRRLILDTPFKRGQVNSRTRPNGFRFKLAYLSLRWCAWGSLSQQPSKHVALSGQHVSVAVHNRCPGSLIGFILNYNSTGKCKSSEPRGHLSAKMNYDIRKRIVLLKSPHEVLLKAFQQKFLHSCNRWEKEIRNNGMHRQVFQTEQRWQRSKT